MTRGRLRPWLGALLIFSSLTCTDSTGLHSGRAALGLAPVLSARAAAIYSNVVAAGLSINNVRLQLDRADGSKAVDTTVTIAAGQDSIVIEIQVDVSGGQETLKAKIDLRDGTVVLFSGTQDVLAIAGGAPQASAPSIKVEYDGPGANIASVSIAHDDTIATGDSVVYSPTAKDNLGASVTDFALLWSLKDSTLGTLSSSGVFTAGNERGQTYVVARTFTGVRDSARVTIVPPMTKLLVVSGADQTGTVGKALPQPVIFEAQAADNLPVAKAQVTVSVTAGGGSVVPASVVTADANGRVSLSFTMGSTIGANTLEAMGTAGTAVVVSATAIADGPRALAITQQPTATAANGAVLTTQPTLQLRDQFGNNVAVAGKPVVAGLLSAGGRTLAGTTTVNSDASGVATFTDLKLIGPVGSVTLKFTQDTLPQVTSNAITLTLGAPAIMTITAGEGLGALAGHEAATAPKVLVTDAGLNPLAGVHVSFEVTSGEGEVNDGNASTDVVTDANGLATTDWHLGSSGAQELTATVSGVTPLVFHATLAQKLVILQQPPITPQADAALTPGPRVQLQDLAGHQAKASGLKVDVSQCCRDDGLELSDIFLTGTDTVATDANGEALFSNLVLNGAVGVQARLVFAATGVDTARSDLVTITAGAPAFIAFEEGNYAFTDLLGVNVVGLRVFDGLENVVANVGVQLFIDAGPCTVPAATLTTDENGFAQANVTIPTAFTSCIIRVQMVGPGEQPKAYQRRYLTGEVESPFKIWIGAVSDDWSDPANWLDNCVPSSATPVFVPFASGAADGVTRRDPKLLAEEGTLSSGGLYTEANAHVYLNSHELYVNTGLAAYGSIEGPGTLAVGTVAESDGFGLQGIVHALLEVGADNCTDNNVYFAFGRVVADSVVLNCPLLVADSGMTVAGDLRVAPYSFESELGGGLLQTGGTISVGGKADLNGAWEQDGGLLTVGGTATVTGFAELFDGMFDVKGHINILSDCGDNEFYAASPHVVRMSGAAADTLFLNVNAPECGASFGTIEIATTGAKGVAMPPHDATYIELDSLRVKSGALLTMSATAASDIYFLSNGALDIEVGGTLVLEPGGRPRNIDTCSLTTVNPGLLHCDYTVIEALRAPARAGTKPNISAFRTKMATLKAKALARKGTTAPGKAFKK